MFCEYIKTGFMKIFQYICVQVPLEYEGEVQYMVQTTLQDPYDMSGNEVDDIVVSQCEEENDDTKSEPPSCVECSSGDEDDDPTGNHTHQPNKISVGNLCMYNHVYGM